MRTSSLSGALLLCLVLGASAHAAELLYFFSPTCGYCRAFDEEVAGIYPRTDAGTIAPMRRIEVDPETFEALEAGLPFEAGTVPTFILVDEGKEVARLNGYSGDELFWMSMQRLLDLLDQ